MLSLSHHQFKGVTLITVKGQVQSGFQESYVRLQGELEVNQEVDLWGLARRGQFSNLRNQQSLLLNMELSLAHLHLARLGQVSLARGGQ